MVFGCQVNIATAEGWKSGMAVVGQIGAEISNLSGKVLGRRGGGGGEANMYYLIIS